MMNKMNFRLTDRDMDFLVETVAPETSAKYRLKQILQEDEDFRSSFLTDEKGLQKDLEFHGRSVPVLPPGSVFHLTWETAGATDAAHIWKGSVGVVFNTHPLEA